MLLCVEQSILHRFARLKCDKHAIVSARKVALVFIITMENTGHNALAIGVGQELALVTKKSPCWYKVFQSCPAVVTGHGHKFTFSGTKHADYPAQPEIEAVIDSAEYQRVVDAYSDKDGRLSYTLLNKDLIQTAKASGQVRLMIEDHASLEEIRLQVVKAKLRSVSRNPALTDEQVQLMIELLDEISPKGVLRPLNEEIRKWLRDGKMK